MITEWLNEESEHEFSDVDDEGDDPNFQPEIEYLEDDEISVTEESSQELIQEPAEEERVAAEERTFGEPSQEVFQEPVEEERPAATEEPSGRFKGKNGFIWNSQECPRTSRTAAHNIIRLPRRLNSNSNFEGYFELWSKLFDHSMLESLIGFTNQKLSTYRAKFKQSTKTELMDTNVTEMKAFIGIMYYSSVFKCNDSDLKMIFATDGTGHEIFRCVISKYRFSCLINCLRFDDSTIREERLKEDRLAPISDLFNKFISNCQSQYCPGPYLCIDEMLLAYRGRCKFIIYMPQKPAKYGIKIMVLSDART